LPKLAEGEKPDKLLVLKDKHGVQSARIIGRRTVFLARAMYPVRMDIKERKVSKMAVSSRV